MQNDTATNNTDSAKSSDKKSLMINMASLKSDSTTDEIFGMTEYLIEIQSIVMG